MGSQRMRDERGRSRPILAICRAILGLQLGTGTSARSFPKCSCLSRINLIESRSWAYDAFCGGDVGPVSEGASLTQAFVRDDIHRAFSQVHVQSQDRKPIGEGQRLSRST
jgi:hypothetical protein